MPMRVGPLAAEWPLDLCVTNSLISCLLLISTDVLQYRMYPHGSAVEVIPGCWIIFCYQTRWAKGTGVGIKVTVWTNAIFRSDHFPVSMDLPRHSAPLRIPYTPKTRYRLTTTEPVHDRTRYNCIVHSHLASAMGAPLTVAQCQEVSSAVSQSIRDVFGDPVECGEVPMVVSRQREAIERFVKQNPKWLTSATGVMRMHVRKRALQVSWDISSMETYLGVRPIGSRKTGRSRTKRLTGLFLTPSLQAKLSLPTPAPRKPLITSQPWLL